jgi:hypothetical protein
MKQFERQESVAWFKLAEFIERGEKERALGIYKLLALSINNEAFTYQLEGDILLAFEDTAAKEKYLQAAEYYLKQNNVAAAVGTLNHLVLLDPKETSNWILLTKIYLENYLDRINRHLRNLINYKQIECAKNCVVEAVLKHKKNNDSEKLATFIADLKLIDSELYDTAQQTN